MTSMTKALATLPLLALLAQPALSAPLPRADVGAGLPVILAQAADPRIAGMEETIRQLNGRVEELNFQILQMQDQLRKMQEDNEFRFQEIEKQKEGSVVPAGEPKQDNAAVPEAAPKADSAAAAEPAEAPKEEAAEAPKPEAGQDVVLGAPEKPLGTITFDANGNPKGGAEAVDPVDGAVLSALPPSDDPEELYRNSYQFILSGDYKTAETGFRDYAEKFPGDARAADAQYWLGEALIGQERYRDAAEVFLAANKAFPKARKAPDMMLKLGVSLAAMKQRDVACATFGEIGTRYPGASDALKGRVKQEQALAGC